MLTNDLLNVSDSDDISHEQAAKTNVLERCEEAPQSFLFALMSVSRARTQIG